MPVKSGSSGSSGSFTNVFPGESIFAQKTKLAVLKKKWQFCPLKLPIEWQF